jgi:hypothetical protein
MAWMNQKVSESYSEAATLELRDRGKHTIIPPSPKTVQWIRHAIEWPGYLPSFVSIIGSLEYI